MMLRPGSFIVGALVVGALLAGCQDQRRPPSVLRLTYLRATHLGSDDLPENWLRTGPLDPEWLGDHPAGRRIVRTRVSEIVSRPSYMSPGTLRDCVTRFRLLPGDYVPGREDVTHIELTHRCVSQRGEPFLLEETVVFRFSAAGELLDVWWPEGGDGF